MKTISGCLGGLCASIVGVPGVAFVLEALRRNESNGELTRRVARLKDLPIGKPIAVPIIGARQDAWTVHPDEVLGRVWLVRKKSDGGAEAEPSVVAFSAICPHLGCMIQHDSKSNGFQCPCHRATFGLDGEKTSTRGQNNYAPRAMDSLNCRLVTDDETKETWVEVTFQKFEQGLTTKVAKA